MRVVQTTGHRGAAGLEPENTLRSFIRACDLGVDYVETDVHLTRDGHLVCIHDSSVDRTTNGSGEVAEMTLEELKRLDAGFGQEAPTLEEALKAVRGRAAMEIELKGRGTAAPVAQVVEREGLGPGEVMVISFHPELLCEMYRLQPQIPLGFLATQPSIETISLACRLGAAAVCLYWPRVTPALMAAAHESGLQVRVWTVNSEQNMLKMLEMGVDAITSDRPDLLAPLVGSWEVG